MRSPLKLLLLLVLPLAVEPALLQNDQAKYLEVWDELIKDSYEVDLPGFVTENCKSQGQNQTIESIAVDSIVWF
jgi:hypothetical protein